MNGNVSTASSALTDSRLATVCAQTVQSMFDRYLAEFENITRRARDRFLDRDWSGSNADAAARLHLYTEVLNDLVARIEQLMGPKLQERKIWTAIKAVYSSLIANSSAWEIAESFFNSVTRRVFATEGVDQAIEFVDTDFDAPSRLHDQEMYRSYSGNSLTELLLEALTSKKGAGFGPECWDALETAAALAGKRLEGAFSRRYGRPSGSTTWRLEVINTAFYRGRGAFLVGLIASETDEAESLPLALSLRHPGDSGILLDAALMGENDLAILFSYTRSYFRVETRCPYELVRYLGKLMPLKRLIDLYTAIGFHRHGKTEFYRDFVAHLHSSNDQFTLAEGAPGMVMLVFTLPSYDVVFKLIKDQFDFPKNSTRADVTRRYRLVFEHDRAGRLVEAYEFEHLRFAAERFDTALLDLLRREAAETVRIEGNDIIIGHLYIERRVRPLNLFFLKADTEAGAAAGRDYGQAIKDLAASNIFPGDLLTKNFGLTRTGRVVFYDYDELCFVTDCTFRRLPEAKTYEEEIAAEPWFSVREADIFPEEFLRFIALPEAAREALLQDHGDLFEAGFWCDVQQRLRAGELPEIFPYPPERRLKL